MLHTNNDISSCACVFTVVPVFFFLGGGGSRVGGEHSSASIQLRRLFQHNGKTNLKSLSDVAPCVRFACATSFNRTDSLHDPVTCYNIICATKSHMLVSKLRSGNSKTKAGPGGLVRVALFLKSLFLPCDRIVQRAYYLK